MRLQLPFIFGGLHGYIAKTLKGSVSEAACENLENFLSNPENLQLLADYLDRQQDRGGLRVAVKAATQFSPALLQSSENFLEAVHSLQGEHHHVLKFLARPGVLQMLAMLVSEKEKRKDFELLLKQMSESPDSIFSRIRSLGVAGKAGEGPGGEDAKVGELLERMTREYGFATSLDEMHIVPKHVGTSASLLEDLRDNSQFASLATSVVQSEDGLLHYDRLFNIYQALSEVIQRFKGQRIVALEAGVYRGKTSEFICKALVQLNRAESRFFSVDTFEGHSEKDLPAGHEGAHTPGKFSDTNEEKVRQMLAGFPFAEVLRGRVQDRAPGIDEPTYHFVHLDMDIYEPTIWGLEYFMKKMPKGGVVMVDDYRKKKCPGILSAIDEFCLKNPNAFFRFDTQTAQCLLVRQD